MEVVLILVAILWSTYLIYTHIYFNSEKFFEIKNSIEAYTKNCNELNEHIEVLKNTYVDLSQIDYGQADHIDTSNYNFRRPKLKKIRETGNVYNCSLSVLRNAREQPFKYICKYFNVKASEDSLANFERVLNDFSAAEQGKILLENERDKIVESISNKIPFLIKFFSKKRLVRQLGFSDIDFSQLYFPKFSFRYVSGGGNSSQSVDVVLDIENLDRFVCYLATIIKFRKSVAGQRALMTTSLREKIKIRDKYTCRHCKNSTYKEPNLLLEIDHIIPLSKSGLTSENNLQTLCWKCNRSKGSKIIV